jgi:hypothetical protein
VLDEIGLTTTYCAVDDLADIDASPTACANESPRSAIRRPNRPANSASSGCNGTPDSPTAVTMSNHWSISADSASVSGVGVLRISADTCSAADLSAPVRWSGACAVGAVSNPRMTAFHFRSFGPTRRHRRLPARQLGHIDSHIGVLIADEAAGLICAGEITMAWIDGTTVGYVRIRRLDGRRSGS